MKPGKFIVIEGPNRAGKSTLLREVSSRYEALARTVVAVREPGGTPLGEGLRAVLKNPEMRGGPFATALAFNAARRELADTIIRPSIKRGDVVICDRYFPSTEIFQIAMGIGMSVEEESFLRVLHRALPQPDLLIFVLPAKELWMARMSQSAAVDAFEGNAGELDAYEAYAAKAAARGPVVILRPTQSMESMTDSISALIDRVG